MAGINNLRAEHGVPSLSYDLDIANYSQRQIAEITVLQLPDQTTLIQLSQNFRELYPNNPYGETVLYLTANSDTYSNNSESQNQDQIDIDKFINSFLDIGFYYYGTEPPLDENDIINEKLNRFTRILWRNSERVGFGCGVWNDASGNNPNSFIITINLSPPGGQRCQYRPNVLPEIGTSDWDELFPEYINYTYSNSDQEPPIPHELDVLNECEFPLTTTTTTSSTALYCPECELCPPPSIPEIRYCTEVMQEKLLNRINNIRQINSENIIEDEDYIIMEELDELLLDRNISKYSQVWADYLATRSGYPVKSLIHEPNNLYNQDEDFLIQINIELNNATDPNYPDDLLENVTDKELLDDPVLYSLIFNPDSYSVGFGCASYSSIIEEIPYVIVIIVMNVDQYHPLNEAEGSTTTTSTSTSTTTTSTSIPTTTTSTSTPSTTTTTSTSIPTTTTTSTTTPTTTTAATNKGLVIKNNQTYNWE